MAAHDYPTLGLILRVAPAIPAVVRPGLLRREGRASWQSGWLRNKANAVYRPYEIHYFDLSR